MYQMQEKYVQVSRKGKRLTRYIYKELGIEYKPENKGEIRIGGIIIRGNERIKEGAVEVFYALIEGQGKKVYNWSQEVKGEVIQLKTKALGQGKYKTVLTYRTKGEGEHRHIEVIHGKKRGRKNGNKKM